MRILVSKALHAVLAGLALIALAGAAWACSGPISSGDGLLVACTVDAPGAPTAPPEFTLVGPGSIAFGMEARRGLLADDRSCGTQAVLRAKTTITASSTTRGIIPWTATLARPGPAASPDPVDPTMTLFRVDPGGAVVVETSTCARPIMPICSGLWWSESRPGAYLMRIVSGVGDLLAEGRFEIVAGPATAPNLE